MKKTTTLLALLLGSVFAGQAKDTKPLQPPSAKTLHFTENKGQVTDQHLQQRADIDFKLAAGNGLNIFIGKGKLAYQWAKRVNEQSDFGHVQELSNDDKEEQDTYALYRMDVELIGANTQAKVIKEGLQSGYERHFQPWVNLTNSNHGVPVSHYNKLTYQNIYPHIDWVFYFNDKGQLEHDFVVRPGGNVSDIKIRYKGAQQLQVNTDGSLSAKTALGSIKENAPIAYEQTGKPVPVSFVLNKDILSFATAAYKGILIIDPVIEWGSYFGGTATDAGMDITTDKWGNVYLCGSTNSVANIATVGAHQVTFAGAANDAFLSKWNSDGALLWSTYYGGTNVDLARGVACDTLGNVYLGGNTTSASGISTIGSFQEVLDLGNDAFLIKMDSSGIRSWGTYFGGSNHDAQSSFAMSIDAANNLYLVGNTQSNNLPSTLNTHQPTHGGGHDAFISRWNTQGQLIWCTYYGGAGADYGNGVGADSSGNIFLAGYTQSISGIATANAYQTTNGGGQDAFVAMFDANGQRIWGSYYGGSGIDRANSIAVRGAFVCIAGLTVSANAIATASSHQDMKSGGDDGFLAMFDHNGVVKWGSYYGSEGQDHIQDIHFSNDWDLYVSGAATGDTGIATSASMQELRAGLRDLFVAKFDTLGIRKWASYYGGSESDAIGVTTIFENNIYLSGSTQSAAGIALGSGTQQVFNGGTDGLLVRINDCPKPDQPANIIGSASLCANATALYATASNGSFSFNWILPAGWLGSSDSSSIEVTANNTSGTIQVISINACGAQSDTQHVTVSVMPIPTPTVVLNGFVLSTTQAFSSYQWLLDGNDISGATQPTLVATEDGIYNVKVTDGQGCEGVSEGKPVNGTVNVLELKDSWKLSVYPSPVVDYIWIELSEAGIAKIWGIDGRTIIKKTTLQNGLNSIAVTDWPAGLYFLRIETSSGNKTYKITKQ